MNDDYPDEGEQPSEEWLAGYKQGKAEVVALLPGPAKDAEWLLSIALMEVLETKGEQKPPKDWSWRQVAMAVREVMSRFKS